MRSSAQEGRLFNVRRLVALDMGLHGPTPIHVEYGLGVPVAMILGVFLALQGLFPFGAYVFTLGVNYLPLLAYAVSLRNDYGDVVDMGDPGVGPLNRKYSTQQFLIFVPFSVVALAVVQWFRA